MPRVENPLQKGPTLEHPMNITYWLRVLLDGGSEKRGTAWFLRKDLVVTALHVVADDTGQWLSGVFPNVQYRLEPKGAAPIDLEPVVGDSRADIALLKPVKPVTGASVLVLAADALAKTGVRWETVGYPEFHPDAFGLGGTLTAIHAGVSQSTVQLNTREGTSIAWEGISGSPVQIGSEVAGVVTRVTYGTNTVWAAPAAALRALLEFSRSSDLIAALSTLLHDVYREPADMAHLSAWIPTDLSSYTTLADAARSLAERAWRSGPHAFATLLARLADDHPDSPRIAELQSRLAVPPGARDGISQASTAPSKARPCAFISRASFASTPGRTRKSWSIASSKETSSAWPRPTAAWSRQPVERSRSP